MRRARKVHTPAALGLLALLLGGCGPDEPPEPPPAAASSLAASASPHPAPSDELADETAPAVARLDGEPILAAEARALLRDQEAWRAAAETKSMRP